MPFYGQGWFHVTTYHLAHSRPLSLSVSVTSANPNGTYNYNYNTGTRSDRVSKLWLKSVQQWLWHPASSQNTVHYSAPPFCYSAPGPDRTNATLIYRYYRCLGDTDGMGHTSASRDGFYIIFDPPSPAQNCFATLIEWVSDQIGSTRGLWLHLIIMWFAETVLYWPPHPSDIIYFATLREIVIPVIRSMNVDLVQLNTH